MNPLLHLISRFSERTGFTRRCIARRQSGGQPALTVLAYHRIGQRADIGDPSADLLDEKLISASPAGFDWQVAYLRQHFQLVSASEVAAAARAEAVLPPNAALITFDDGYRDNYTLAFPVLQKHQAPAVIFLTTSLINSDKLPWWDEVSYLLRSSSADAFTLAPLGRFSLRSQSERARAREKLRAYIKSLTPSQQLGVLEDLRQQLAPITSKLRQQVFMNWEEVNQMRDAGIAFGAHTHSHAILTRLPLEQAQWEIDTSRRIIVERTACPVELFAYPNGGPGDYNGQTREILVEQGFAAAFTLRPGNNRNQHPAFDWLTLRRVSIYSDDRSVFTAKVSGALETLMAPAFRALRASPYN